MATVLPVALVTVAVSVPECAVDQLPTRTTCLCKVDAL